MSENKTAGRLQALRQAMSEAEVDLVVLGPGSHMRWLLGFAPHADERPCLLFVGTSAEAFLMPGLNADDVAARCDIPLHRWSDGHGPADALAGALAEVEANTVARVAVDETLRADHALLALDALPGVARCFAGSLVGALRLTKDADERRGLTASARLNDTAMQAAFAAVRPGATEREIAAVVHRHYLDHGARPAFDIVGGGPNGAYPHHETGDRPLEDGDPVVIDIGCVRDGWPSDMTRMAIAGQPSDEYLRIHGIVEAAVAAALATARPGVAASAVDAAARDVIVDAGFGDYFTTRTGHGLGLDLHEAPYLSTTSDTVLAPGMVFSIEPGIYRPGRFGVRLEEIVYLGEDGPEIFSTLGRDAHRAGR